MLGNNAFGQVGQSLEGYWTFEDEDDSVVFRLSALGGPWFAFHHGLRPRVFEDLRVGQRNHRSENFAGVWGQFKRREHCLVGLTASIEKRIPGVPPRCPQYMWWDHSQACFAAQGLRDGQLTVQGYRHEPPKCEQDKGQPARRQAKLKRFIGVSFAPISQGRYIHVTAVAAPQGYRAAARIAWDYGEVQSAAGRPVRVRIQSGAGNGGASVVLANALSVSGTYDIRGDRPGRTRLTVSALSDQGRVLHTDEMAVDFPRIPGLN